MKGLADRQAQSRHTRSRCHRLPKRIVGDSGASRAKWAIYVGVTGRSERGHLWSE